MDAIEELLPPHDNDAEAAVLGSILVDPDAYYEVSEVLDAGMFYRASHRWLYQAIDALNSRNEAADVLTIAAELNRAGKLDEFGGVAYLIDLSNAVPTSIHADTYARIVAEKATRRRLIQAAGAVAKAAYDEATPLVTVCASAESAVIAAAAGMERGGAVSAQRYMSDYLDDFLGDVGATDTPRTIATGLVDLDRMLGGLEAPHQYILAGRTSMGKSALALSVIRHAALRQGKRTALFSLEMSQEQIVNRLISMMTHIPAQDLKAARRRYLSPAQQQAVMNAAAQISDAPLHLDCTAGLRPTDIRSRAARIHAALGLDLIIVDHMHIMAADAPTGKQVQDLGSISLALAGLYKSLNVAGLTLAQLNRGVDSRAIKRPMLSDLRESGQIEENAYAVLFIHRDGYYDDTASGSAAELIIAKNRDGATGSVGLYWNAPIAMYGNAAQVQL